MIVNLYTAQNIILATVGLVGLLGTATVLTYSFRRNRNDSQNFQ